MGYIVKSDVFNMIRRRKMMGALFNTKIPAGIYYIVNDQYEVVDTVTMDKETTLAKIEKRMNKKYGEDIIILNVSELADLVSRGVLEAKQSVVTAEKDLYEAQRRLDALAHLIEQMPEIGI